jgi:predicted  nucleic acid-binding Zn-ribbon protein
MPGTEEFITKEFIETLKADREKIISKHKELIDFTKKLIEKDEQISRIKQDIEVDLRNPIKPWQLDLDSNWEWNQYFDEAERLIQEKEKQDALREQLKGLEKERKDIESQIAPLVPSSLHGIKIKVHNIQQMIFVDGETVSLG